MSDKLRELVNQSGFPFQLAVEAAVRATEGHSQWNVLTSEHPWSEPGTDESGFADLVLWRGNVRLVVECKRVRDGQWVFLVPEPEGAPVSRFCAAWTEGTGSAVTVKGWDDFDCKPESFESSFCVVRGTDGTKELSLLERLGSRLARATEVIRDEHGSLPRVHQNAGGYIFVPVIVTTAEIHVCLFASKEVDLSTGELAGGEFSTVDWIRFRKSLTTQQPTPFRAETLVQTNEAKVRSIWVVQAAAFPNWLRKARTQSMVDGYPPWRFARERAQ